MLNADAIREIKLGVIPTRFELSDGTVILASGLGNQAYVPANDKPLPGHIRQKVSIFSTQSFIDYVNAFKGMDTQIFADPQNNFLRSVIDYHKTPVDAPPPNANVAEVIPKSGPLPDYADHRAEMEIPFSEQWARWSEIDGKAMTQGDFAEFLEENYLDVATPDHASLLEIVTTLQAINNVAFSSAIKLQTGETQFTYTEAIEGKGKGNVSVPSEIRLLIPIHFDGAAKDVRCFLRYRIQGGKLTFIVKINRRQMMEKEAFIDIVNEIHEKTEIKPIYGTI